MIAIGAAGILVGESCIWKMKNIGEEIAGAEDEACDRLEYEYEKAGAFGMKANIITQALCMLVLSTGYSMKYIGTEASRNGPFPAGVHYIYPVLCISGILAGPLCEMRAARYPRKKRSGYQENFRKNGWKAAMRQSGRLIYQSAYKSYMTANKTIPPASSCRDAVPPVLRYRDHGGRASGGGVDHCDASYLRLLREDPERKTGLRRT